MYNIVTAFKKKYFKTLSILLGMGFLVISGCQPKNINSASDEGLVEINDSLSTVEDATVPLTEQPEETELLSKPTPAPKTTDTQTPKTKPATEPDLPQQTRPMEPAAAYGTMPSEYRPLNTTIEKKND